MATNGTRKVMRMSYAPKVGNSSPLSGDSADANAAPLLASAKARTAAMKLKPVSGPATSSSSENDVEPKSSRQSFSMTARKLLQRKEDLFERGVALSDARAQLAQIAGGDGASV